MFLAPVLHLYPIVLNNTEVLKNCQDNQSSNSYNYYTASRLNPLDGGWSIITKLCMDSPYSRETFNTITRLLKKRRMWNDIKRISLLLFVCFILLGCTPKENDIKGEYDLKGNITKMDKEVNRILIEDLDKGLAWISLHENEKIENFNLGQKVAVWVDGGILTSSPAYAKALHIEIIEETKTVQTSIPEFIYEQNEFPPVITGIVTIDGTRYQMTKGHFKWEKGNKTVQTDALSPTQIAQNYKAITVEPSSKAFIEIEQNPHLVVYLWESEERKLVSQGSEILVPTKKGRSIYEVLASWSNGEVSYTFVVNLN